MKIFIAAMGSGEIGQGISFAKYAISRGSQVIFSVFDKKYLPFVNLEMPNFSYIVVNEDIDSLNKAIGIASPELLVLCNSKILQGMGYSEQPPTPKPSTISIDSNWLFSKDSPWKSMSWVDTYCINLPEEVFKLGLKKNGGKYDISEAVMSKIKVVGLVPSYESIASSTKEQTRIKYGISNEEKMIVLYASTASLKHVEQIGIYNKALESVSKLIAEGHSIKVISVGNMPGGLSIQYADWLIDAGSVSGTEFYNIIGSSDLVFQHQGLGTMEQAISATVPIIANVKDLKDEENSHHAHEWEVLPFARYGVCTVMHFSDNTKTVGLEIKRLLFDNNAILEMKRCQAQLYKKGEPAIYEEALRLVGDSQ